jgi:hypothetical protein
VGYSDSSKAYRIYILEQHKIKVSRDVTFNEKMAFRKSIEEIIEEEEFEEPNEENTENENDENDQPDHPMEPCENNDSVIIPVSDQKRTNIFERTMSNIVGKFLIASRAPNADLKAPLESSGFVDVDRLFKHAKQTLHD